jgi:uncharacterized protein YdcH (DUF465 family)
MSNTPHTLGEEFPTQMQKLSELKVSNAHFARLLAEYDEVNDAVHRAETRVDMLTEAAEQALRRKRLALKDEISKMLAA